MREELRRLIKPRLPADWLRMSEKISTDDWELFAYDPNGQLGRLITSFSAPFPGALIYVKVRLEPNPSIVWLRFRIRDDHGPLSRAALIETANLSLTRSIDEQDIVLSPPPSAGDVPPEG